MPSNARDTTERRTVPTDEQTQERSNARTEPGETTDRRADTDAESDPDPTAEPDPLVTNTPEALPEHYDPGRVERRVHDHWDRTGAFEYVERKRSDGDPFYFVDGPPFTTGKMHVGNAWGKLLKDALLRYHRMQGANVRARPGYDTHGLPVEVKVEQRNGFETKGDVEDHGLEKFVAECREYAREQEARMTGEFRDLGVWMDFEDAYSTYDPDYVETVWSAFAAVHDRGYVDREKRVVNTCPRCETALADSELDYETRSTTAAYVGFSLADEDATLAAWTTTPWTVVANQFVAVDADAEYAKVALDGHSRATYVASDCLEEFVAALGVEEYEVMDRRLGSELVGRRYEHPLLDVLPDHPLGTTRDDTGADRAATGQVVHADYVDAEKTGVVHSAPGLGHEDFERGRDLGLTAFSPVAPDGTFTEAAGPYAGRPVRDAASAVLSDLDDAGALLGTECHDHEYPGCPRCDADVVYRASEQWLVTVTDAKERLHDALDDVEYHPEGARDERLRTVLENAPDWNVSRQRYWGTPLPVWVCEGCGEETVVGSRAELVGRSDLSEPPADLHRPAVDDVVLSCPACGDDANRVEDVLDVWFDSAVASWDSLDALPAETPAPAEWPADLVVEGQDQTRGWFLMQLYLGVLLADEAPYEEVLMHGFATLDGEPMSKSRGHVLRPGTVVEEYGRDALRAHLLRHDQQERDVNLTGDLSGVGAVRDDLDVVWNAVRFATMYMTEDDHDPVPELRGDPAHRTAVDRWVLSRLETTVEAATAAMDDRRPHDALEATLSFLVDDVSRYYVQSVRDRAWESGDDPSKAAMYDVLGTVLHAATRLLAPFTPFLAEELYGALGGSEPTVHATDWPTACEHRDPELETHFETLRSVESAVARARQRAGRKGRWPVREVVLEPDGSDWGERDAVRAAVDAHTDHLRDRLNAKAVRVTDGFEGTESRVVPEMSEFGPAFGQRAPAVASAVEGLDPDTLPRSVSLDGDGETATVTREMVSVETHVAEGYEAAAFECGTAYVDTTLTPALEREGLVRDVVRRVQRLRSSAGLALDRSVRLAVDAESETVSEALSGHREELKTAVRADEVVEGPLRHETTFELDGGAVEVWLEPVSGAD